MAQRRAVRRLLAAVAVLVVLTSGGCTSSPAPEAQESLLESLYAQVPQWAPCGDAECATIDAPIDWEHPDAGTFGLALARQGALGSEGNTHGSLVTNFGGPGLGWVPLAEQGGLGLLLEPDVLEAYDLVTFDPRGTGRSTPSSCPDDAVAGSWTNGLVWASTTPVTSAADLDRAREKMRGFAEACTETMGPLLEHVGTVDAARDLDLIRAVLGEEKLSYLGLSYGTELGATYAALFPEHVGRMVLDAAVDPLMSREQLVDEQAAAFDASLRAFVADCVAAGDCPLAGDVEDAVAELDDLLSGLDAEPLDAGGGRTVTRTVALSAIFSALTGGRGEWANLKRAVAEALSGSGIPLYGLWDAYAESMAGPVGVAMTEILCLDEREADLSFAELEAERDRVARDHPLVADSGIAPGCQGWPFEAPGLDDYTATGSGPILVIGTTRDPVTPYPWAVRLADRLDSAVLLTYDGDGHGAMIQFSGCVSTAVTEALLDAVLPANGARC